MEGERNFHIFYQILRGASTELKTKMELSDSVSDYHYISDGESRIPSISDEDEFKITCSCMESIGIDKNRRQEIFTAISGILQLGNISFESDQNDYEVGKISKEREDAFQAAARLLGLLPEELLTAMTKQNMHVGGAVIVKPQSHAQVRGPWVMCHGSWVRTLDHGSWVMGLLNCVVLQILTFFLFCYVFSFLSFLFSHVLFCHI